MAKTNHANKANTLKVISMVMNDSNIYVDLDSLPRDEQKKAMRQVQENVIRASAEYHGYNVQFEKNKAILTSRNEVK